MVFVQQALSGNMVIPDWKRFTGMISDIFEECRQGDSGEVSLVQPGWFIPVPDKGED